MLRYIEEKDKTETGKYSKISLSLKIFEGKQNIWAEENEKLLLEEFAKNILYPGIIR